MATIYLASARDLMHLAGSVVRPRLISFVSSNAAGVLRGRRSATNLTNRHESRAVPRFVFIRAIRGLLPGCERGRRLLGPSLVRKIKALASIELVRFPLLEQGLFTDSINLIAQETSPVMSDVGPMLEKTNAELELPIPTKLESAKKSAIEIIPTDVVPRKILPRADPMIEPPETTPKNTGLKGASVGGIIGITVWQILSWNFLNLGFVTGFLVLTTYMSVCMLLGMMIELSISRMVFVTTL